MTAEGTAPVRPCLGESVDRLRARAATAAGGRAAELVAGGRGHALGQTLPVLRAGAVLAEHDNPGEATVLVLEGAVRLQADGVRLAGAAGDLVVVPPSRHSLKAVEDSVVLLTTVRLGPSA